MARPVQSSEDADVLTTLDELAVALDRNASDQRRMAGRVRNLRAQRALGRPWRQIIAGEPKPTALDLNAGMADRLTTCGARLRRALVRALHGEGATVTAIARLFGVTHQRVSTLLRRTD